MSTEEDKQEIIIVKRSGGGGDGHHGGAWKIAFADFMTAMMALFLVLWLVNAANEKTKKSVASYFNPVKLIDRTRSTKGLEESTSSDLPTESDEKEDKGNNESKEDVDVSEVTVKEEDFFKDPFSVLDELASEEMAKIEVAISVTNEFFEASPDQEDALLDPFAEATEPPEEEVPQVAQVAAATSEVNEAPEATSDQGLPEQRGLDSPVRLDNFVLAASLKVDQQEGIAESNQESNPDKVDKNAEANREAKADGEAETEAEAKAEAEADGEAETEAEAKAEVAAKDQPQLDAQNEQADKIKQEEQAKAEKKVADDAKTLAEAKAEAEKQADAAKQIESAAQEIRDQIKQRLTARLGQSEQISESLSVKITDEGVLISITDQFGFSMFQVGSAIPKGEVVLAMAEISTVLSERKGKVRVYGHTDGRPYASDSYDNWRLSTARAHAARLMLERGGLRETRVSQVVGFSDRVLRTPNNPEADENRRIEILLEVL